MALTKHFPEASENPTNLIMVLPQSAWSDPDRLAKATRLLRATRDFTKLTGPLDPNGTTITPAELVSLHNQLGPAITLSTAEPAGTAVPIALYNAYRVTACFVSADGTTVQWEVGLKAGDPSTSAAINAVPAIRTSFQGVAWAVGVSKSGVAGEAPVPNDVSTISDRDLKCIVPIVVVVIGIVLALVLRSLVVPLYLLASVVVSYLASLGLAVIVFVYFAHQGGLTFILPFLMFIFLLALGEDYNILVMSRIREEAARLPLRQAVVKAVGATGSTVTSAGLVLAGTFVVFAVVSARQPGELDRIGRFRARGGHFAGHLRRADRAGPGDRHPYRPAELVAVCHGPQEPRSGGDGPPGGLRVVARSRQPDRHGEGGRHDGSR